MKAANVATILRSMRSRAEMTGGIVQMGEWEHLAIAIALAVVGSDLTPKGVTIEMHGMSFSMLKVDEAWFELIRTAYKMLDNRPPNEDFNVSEDTLRAIFEGKKAKIKKEKPLTGVDLKWLEATINTVPAKASDVKDEPKPEEKKGGSPDTEGAS